MVDFRTILAKPAAEVKKPKALPPGTYHGRISATDFGESRQKKTPQVMFTLSGLMPGEDIDQSLLEGIDLSKKTLRSTYYFTEASEYRVVELAQSMGIITDGMSLAQVVADCMNQPVLITVTQRNSDDGKDIFNDVSELVGTATAEAA